MTGYSIGAGRPSPKRVALAKLEQVLGLYRDRYFDFNVRHFTRSCARNMARGSATPG